MGKYKREKRCTFSYYNICAFIDMELCSEPTVEIVMHDIKITFND